MHVVIAAVLVSCIGYLSLIPFSNWIKGKFETCESCLKLLSVKL